MNTDTPITDGFYEREFDEGRVGWTREQYELAAYFERNQRLLIAALDRIAVECDCPVSNGVQLTPEAALTAIGKYARAAIRKVQS
jgi:hypothetical protein